MFRKFILSNVIVVSFMLTTLPTMAANNIRNFNNTSASTSSSVLVAVDADALNKATEALGRVADLMVAAQSAKSAEQARQNFNAALAAMEESATLLEQAGVPDGAKAMNRALVFMQAAINAESDAEADQLIKDAGKALDDVIAAIEKAAS